VTQGEGPEFKPQYSKKKKGVGVEESFLKSLQALNDVLLVTSVQPAFLTCSGYLSFL
jgi:hypothetical protein